MLFCIVIKKKNAIRALFWLCWWFCL